MVRRKTHEEFIAEVKEMVGDEYLVLSKYINAKEKIRLLHTDCNFEYEVRSSNFLSGVRCPLCFKGIKKTESQFKEDIVDYLGKKFKLISPYKNSTTKVTMKHLVCGKEYKVLPLNISKGHGCPHCAGNYRKNTKMFSDEVQKITKGEYELISEYIRSKDKVKIRHVNCQNTFKVAPGKFTGGSRCPYCNISKGEKTVSDFFVVNNINFIREYKFPNCINKKKLRFDFAVKNSLNQIVAVIEYDGQQHYEPVVHFGGVTALRETQRRDAIKTKYCADNNIPLIRIPYWEYDNIDAILTEKLLPLLYNADNENAS